MTFSKNRDKLQIKADVFKALGSAARLGIVELLGSGEMEVDRIAGLMGTDRSNVSKQLTTLRKCGIVSDRKQGPTVFCTLAIPEIRDFIKRVEAHMAKTDEEQSNSEDSVVSFSLETVRSPSRENL